MPSSKKILIISDGITGHTRQSEAVARWAADIYHARGSAADIEQFRLNVKYTPSRKKKILFYLTHPLAKFCRSGCARCYRYFLQPSDREKLFALKPDLVISPFGKRSSDANLWLARRSGGRSVVVMKPKPPVDRFDLVVVPRHDELAEGKNVVVTEGAPTIVERRTVESQAARLASELGPLKQQRIGLLIGGDYKHFRMDAALIGRLVDGILEAAERADADILATSSRRTPKPVESILKQKLGTHPRCKLLIIANEKNRDGAVPAILGLCRAVVLSPESVTMISEAASSGAKVLVFEQDDFVHPKHRRFLENLMEKGYADVRPVASMSAALTDALTAGSGARVLDDGAAVRKGLEKVL